LGGVYKLSALRNRNGQWEDRLKLSEQAAKTSTPGILQVRRFRHRGELIGDVVFDEKHPIQGDCVAVDPADPTRRKFIPGDAAGTDLLVPVFREGRCVYEVPSLDESRRRAQQQLDEFHPGIKRFVHPHQYPAGLEAGLHQRKTDMILQARGFPS
jgi:nicotinate phosphoribosyltransferase